MKLLIIGGTGKTGSELIKQGLAEGHIITAVVRKPKKIKYSHPNLIVLEGNVLIPESFEKAVQGQDVVLSALGHKKFFIKTTILSRGTENIISAMTKNEIKRFICITSLGINDNKSKQEKLIMNSDLEWTIVRPGQLTNGKKRTIYKHGSNIGHYVLTKMISRADVAHFMLNLLNTNKYLKKSVGLTY